MKINFPSIPNYGLRNILTLAIIYIFIRRIDGSRFPTMFVFSRVIFIALVIHLYPASINKFILLEKKAANKLKNTAVKRYMNERTIKQSWVKPFYPLFYIMIIVIVVLDLMSFFFR